MGEEKVVDNGEEDIIVWHIKGMLDNVYIFVLRIVMIIVIIISVTTGKQ